MDNLGISIIDDLSLQDMMDLTDQYYGFLSLLIIAFWTILLIYSLSGVYDMMFIIGLFMIFLPISYWLCQSECATLSALFTTFISTLMLWIVISIPDRDPILRLS